MSKFSDELHNLLSEIETKIHDLFDEIKGSPEVQVAVTDAKQEVSNLVGDAKGKVSELVSTVEADAAHSAQDAAAIGETTVTDVARDIAAERAAAPATDAAPTQPDPNQAPQGS